MRHSWRTKHFEAISLNHLVQQYFWHGPGMIRATGTTTYIAVVPFLRSDAMMFVMYILRSTSYIPGNT